MENSEFWKIIDTAHNEAGNDVEARVEILERELEKLSVEAIQAFQVNYDEMIHRANQWALWGAAYLMNGGCSDDGFRYFCHWLISEGQDIFERALLNPDSLADRPRMEYFELEAFAYAACKVYESKSGKELERDFSIEFAAPNGEEWSEDELPTLFPRLAHVYLD